MKLNYYIIASLPEIIWDGDIRGTLSEFFKENDFLFEPYKAGVDSILFFNEIKNFEMLLNQNMGELFIPAIASQDEITAFLDTPSVNCPAEYPEYIEEFFIRYSEAGERLAHFDELYLAYYEQLSSSKDPFLTFFAEKAEVLRTIVMAIRLQKKGIALDENLIGTEEIVETIIDYRNSADFGLSAVFPEISELLLIFEKGLLEVEKGLDMFLVELLSEYKADEPFGDHVIYLYIIALFIRERWSLMQSEAADTLLEEIIQG